MSLQRQQIERVVTMALEEDAPFGDVTSQTFVPATTTATAELVARAVTASALRRTESRGGHFRADFPATDPTQAVHSGLVLAR